MSIAGPPAADQPVPALMREVAAGPVTLVWHNEAGGLTGRVDGARERYLKWNPAGSGESLTAEADRLRWLAGRHPVPEVLDLIVRGGEELLVTAAVPARSAVDPRWTRRPDEAIRAIAVGLRALHAVPVGSCPFDWDVASRIAKATGEGHRLPPPLGVPPAPDRLVVCHGDACAPNTLVRDDGHFAAHVDMGRLGVADRWADLAVATLSLGWNYPDPDEKVFWEAYGIEPDEDRIAYYRALWDVT